MKTLVVSVITVLVIVYSIFAGYLMYVGSSHGCYMCTRDSCIKSLVLVLVSLLFIAFSLVALGQEISEIKAKLDEKQP